MFFSGCDGNRICRTTWLFLHGRSGAVDEVILLMNSFIQGDLYCEGFYMHLYGGSARAVALQTPVFHFGLGREEEQNLRHCLGCLTAFQWNLP